MLTDASDLRLQYTVDSAGVQPGTVILLSVPKNKLLNYKRPWSFLLNYKDFE